MKKNSPKVFREKIDKRVFYFNAILSKWIAYYANINIQNVQQKRLLWISLLIVFIHDNWDKINKFYPLQTIGKPSYAIFSSLRHKFSLSMKTDFIIYHFPKPRFFNITGYFRFLIRSINATFNLIEAIKFIPTKQNLFDSFWRQSRT